MATVKREEFSSQLDASLLAWMREVAHREGREFHEVLEDAVRAYVGRSAYESLGPETFALLETIIERYRRIQERNAR